MPGIIASIVHSNEGTEGCAKPVVRLPIGKANKEEGMHKQVKGIGIFVSLLMLATLSTATAAQPGPTPRERPTPHPRNFHTGAVYVLIIRLIKRWRFFTPDAMGSRP